MRIALTFSVLLHLALFALAWLNPPGKSELDIASPRLIDVDVVTSIPQTPVLAAEPAKPKANPEPKPAQAKPPRPAPPPPPQVAERTPEPAPEKPAPKPEPKPEPAAPPKPAPAPNPKPEPTPSPIPKPDPEPLPKPEPAPAPQPEPEPVPKQPEPEPKVEKQPEPEKQVALAPTPRTKPKPPPPDEFDSVLKTVQKLQAQPSPEKPEKKKPEEPQSLADQVNAALSKQPSSPPQRPNAQIGAQLSMSEIESVRRQVEPCWQVPAGARNAEELNVELRVWLRPDGTVYRAEVLDSAKIGRNTFYRAAAESAIRAVLNPRCNPLKLPPEKYDEWKTMTLNFDPKQMLGG